MEALSILALSIMVHNIKVFRKRVLSIMTLSIAPLKKYDAKNNYTSMTIHIIQCRLTYDTQQKIY
jgi:hypothetical protein